MGLVNSTLGSVDSTLGLADSTLGLVDSKVGLEVSNYTNSADASLSPPSLNFVSKPTINR